MTAITQHELETMLMQTARCQFVQLATVTDPDMRKRGNPHFTARKVSIVNGVINWRYARAVKQQLLREGKRADADVFRAFPRKWGQRVKHTPLVSHIAGDEGTCRLYLETKIERRVNHYFCRETGKRIDESELAPWLRDPGPSRQGTDREIILRDFALANIAELTMGGIRYAIAPAVTELQTYLPRKAAIPATAGSKALAKRQPTQGAIS